MLNTKKSALVSVSIFLFLYIVGSFFCLTLLYPVTYTLLPVMIYLLLKAIKQFSVGSMGRVMISAVIGTAFLLMPLVIDSIFPLSCLALQI